MVDSSHYVTLYLRTAALRLEGKRYRPFGHNSLCAADNVDDDCSNVASSRLTGHSYNVSRRTAGGRATVERYVAGNALWLVDDSDFGAVLYLEL